MATNLTGTQEAMAAVRTGYRPATAITATIAAGASLSDVITIPDGYRIDAIQIPSTWDTAGMTVQVSLDGVNFYECYDEYGAPLALYPIVSCVTCLGPENSLRISKRYIKLRSGTAASAVNQVDAVAIGIWLVSM